MVTMLLYFALVIFVCPRWLCQESVISHKARHDTGQKCGQDRQRPAFDHRAEYEGACLDEAERTT